MYVNTFKILKEYKTDIKSIIRVFKAYNLIKKSGLFDEEFYLNVYPEVKGDALTHYLLKGYLKGYLPSLEFDSNFYMEMYPYIKFESINPLLHYVLYGKNAGCVYYNVFNESRKEEICRTNLAFLNNFEFEKEPLVSIIILNKNGLTHLKRLFKDFDKKTNYSNYEIIVVDNASTDESVNYLELLNLPIKIIKNQINKSFSKANNDAVKIAKGEFVLLLNNDIEPTYGWLNELVGTIMQDENIAIVGAKLIFPYYFGDNKDKSFNVQHSGDMFSERIKPCCFQAINKSDDNLDIFDSKLNNIEESIAVTAAVALIRKNIYLELGGLDEEYNYGLEDVDFSLKVHRRGYLTVYSGAALLFHHESSTRNNSPDYAKNARNNFKVFSSKWGKYLSKQLLLDKINNNKFFSKKQLKIVFLSEYNDFLSNVAKDFNERGYEVDIITDDRDNYFGSSSDILISFNNNYDLENMIARKDILKVFVSNDSNLDLETIKDYNILVSENISDFKNVINIPLSNNFARDLIKGIEEMISLEGFEWD